MRLEDLLRDGPVQRLEVAELHDDDHHCLVLAERDGPLHKLRFVSFNDATGRTEFLTSRTIESRALTDLAYAIDSIEGLQPPISLCHWRTEAFVAVE